MINVFGGICDSLISDMLSFSDRIVINLGS